MGCEFLNVGANSPYRTIQDALDWIDKSAAASFVITLEKGIYKEKLRIMKPNVTLRGVSPDNTIITYDDCAVKILPDGRKMGTFNSFTVYLGGRGFRGENLTIENSSGPGRIAGQAVALYADADDIRIKNCRLIGHQDTLCTGPLPVDPLPGGINPLYTYRYTDDADKPEFHQYYEDCFISGDIDFIFGSAGAVFTNCEIFSRKMGPGEQSYITAGSHTSEEKEGYVFINCRLTGDADAGSVFLGRPWRPHAFVTFENCFMDKHIIPGGWDNWNSREKERTARYSEINSRGPGAAPHKRVSWAVTR